MLKSILAIALLLPAAALAAKPASCAVVGIPSQFTPLGALNNGNYAAFGSSMDAVRTTIAGNDVVLAAIGGLLSPALDSNGQVNVFFLDPVTGAILDGTFGQPHLTMNLDSRVALGDVLVRDLTGDGVLDVLISSGRNNAGAWVFRGHVDGDGFLTYSDPAVPLAAGEPADAYGHSIAAAVLDPSGIATIAVSAPALYNGSQNPGRVILFKFDGLGFTKLQTIVDPQNAAANHFGTGVAFGDLTGDGLIDLAVGAMDASGTASRTAGAGRVYVYSGAAPGAPVILTANVKGEGLGQRANTGNLDNTGPYQDLLAVGKARALMYPGPAGVPGSTVLQPLSGSMANGFGLASNLADIDGDGIGDAMIGAYLAGSGGNCQNGAAYVYLSGQGFARYTMQPAGTGQFATGFGVWKERDSC